MKFVLANTALGLLLFASFFALQEAGRRRGRARAERADGGAPEGRGGVEAAVYGLLGLLIAFMFSGAATRFEARQFLILDEANAIGTAYLRLDLLPPEVRDRLRAKMAAYTDARIAVPRAASGKDVAGMRAAIVRTGQLQQELWSDAVASAQASSSPAVAQVLLPALNEMFDLGTSRIAASYRHPPTVLFAMLIGIGFISSFLAGHTMGLRKHRDLVHMVA